MPEMRVHVATVKLSTEQWHDEFNVVHVMRSLNASYTMCHKWVRIKGYTEDAPNCLLCITIER